MLEGPWIPLVPEEKAEDEYIIVMCREGGELNCFVDGTVVCKQGSRMYEFRLPPSVRLFQTRIMGIALAERKETE